MKMSAATKLKALGLILSNPSLVLGKSKQLFILSHMRSRSSVLSHVLGSNEEICGYSELHNSYLNHKDIVKLRVELYADLKCDLAGKYLLDKLLGNQLKIDDDILTSKTTRCIFLLREPESTIKSIVSMGYKTDIDWYKDPEKAAEYYIQRLERLLEYAAKLNKRYFFIESESLVNNTDELLANLSDWLELIEPLSNNYNLFNNSGKERYGDPSEKILAGKIKKTESNLDVEIPDAVLTNAKKSYEYCKSFLEV